jgi:hypothetical protein
MNYGFNICYEYDNILDYRFDIVPYHAALPVVLLEVDVVSRHGLVYNSAFE